MIPHTPTYSSPSKFCLQVSNKNCHYTLIGCSQAQLLKFLPEQHSRTVKPSILTKGFLHFQWWHHKKFSAEQDRRMTEMMMGGSEWLDGSLLLSSNGALQHFFWKCFLEISWKWNCLHNWIWTGVAMFRNTVWTLWLLFK